MWRVGVAVLLCAFAAQAHLVVGTKTLHGSIAEADLVLRARIVAVDAGPVATPEHPGSGRPGVEAEVLEVLEGDFDAPHVRFAQHGHGVARFEPGSEVLLFLVDIARSRELDSVGQRGGYAWVSFQEHQQEYPLEPHSRDRLLAAARSYVAADATGSATERLELRRRATRELLLSGDTRLASSALRDLVAAPGVPLVTAQDLPALMPLLEAAETSMGLRVGLLVELERRGLVEGTTIWLQLLSPDTESGDRVVAVRAAGASGSEAVRARLVALVSDPDLLVAAAAASALGSPGRVDAVAPLTGALSHESEKVRMAAIRGLGRVALPESREALEIAAASHPDPATRRRARAEVRKQAATPTTD